MRRPGRKAAYAVAALASAVVLYDLAALAWVAHADRNASRDPETGILTGAEERVLGPADAPGAVLFVHGFAGAGNNFWEVPDRVADHGWRVEVMRLPYHGTTAREFAGMDADVLVDAVKTRVQWLKAEHETVVLVGHSMGGALCTIVAADEPVDGLVLGAAYFAVPHKWYYGLKPEAWSKLTRYAVPYVYKGRLFTRVNRKAAKDDIVSYTWLPAAATVELAGIGRQASDPERLARIACPVLMLHGPEDPAASYSDAEKAVGAMASVSKRIVPLGRSSHHIFWDYDRDVVVQEILIFLDSLSTAGG